MYMYVTNCVYALVAGSYGALGFSSHELSADMSHLCIYISVTNCVDTLVAGSYGTPGFSSHELSADMNHLLYTYVRHELCGYTCCWLLWGTRSLESSTVLISCVCVLQCVLHCMLQCVVVCVAECVINYMQMCVTKNTYMYVSICVNTCTSRFALIHLWFAPMGHQVPQIMNCLQIRVIYYIYMCATKCVHTFVAGFYWTLN